MSDTTLTALPAAELARLVASGDATAHDAVQASLDMVAGTHGGADGLNYRIAADDRAALHDARSIDRAADRADRLLAGVPVVIKDNLATLTLPTTCGSRILQGYVSPFEATVVARLREAGAVVRRQDEHGRVRDGLVHRVQRLRTDPQPARSLARARRIVRRLRGGRRSRRRAHRARLRDRRLGTPAGGVLRRRRREAHLRPGEPLRAGRLRLVARPGRRLRP